MRVFEFFSGIGGMRLAVEEALGPRAKDVTEITAFDISSVPNAVYQHNFKPTSAKAAKKAAKAKAKAEAAAAVAAAAAGNTNETAAKAPAAAEKASSETVGESPAGHGASHMQMTGLQSCRLVPKLIEQLSLKDLDGKADLWTMSPPCQPFTTTANAKAKGADDNRCEGFLALLRVLDAMEHPPHRILLENVKGFMDTSALDMMKAVLKKRGYTYRQYLLSPLTVGIPNNRTRYYLLCERSDRFGPPAEDPRADPVHVDMTGAPRSREEMKEYAGLLVALARAGGRCGRCPLCNEIHVLPPPANALGADAAAAAAAPVEDGDDDAAAQAEGGGEDDDNDEGDAAAAAAPTAAAAAPAPITWDPAMFCAGKFPALNVRALRGYVEDGVPAEEAGNKDNSSAAADPAASRKRKLDDVAADGDDAADPAPKVRVNRFGQAVPVKQARKLTSLFLSKDTLAKPYAHALSIVSAEEGVTFCYTKNYGKVLHKSSGSLYYDPAAGANNEEEGGTAGILSTLDRQNLVNHHGQVRLFSPRELLNLMGFPAWFAFPDTMPLIQRYRCIGNSVSVHAVAAVAKVLLEGA